MPNTIVTPSWVLKEVGRAYVNSVKFISNIRQYSNQYEFGGAKVGNTVQYRLPQRWQATDGQALQEQPILDLTVPKTGREIGPSVAAACNDKPYWFLKLADAQERPWRCSLESKRNQQTAEHLTEERAPGAHRALGRESSITMR